MYAFVKHQVANLCKNLTVKIYGLRPLVTKGHLY
jgi:hypothetical protein